MEKKTRNIEVKRDGRVCYRIWLEPDFVNLPAALKELGTEKKKLCIVTDTTVAELYAGQLQEVLQQCCNSVSLFVFPAGEEHKTCLLYTSPSPQDMRRSRMPSSA